MTLETIRDPSYSRPAPKPGQPEPPFELNSPRSVYVCMRNGVDPVNLLPKPLTAFEKPGQRPDLTESAKAHHETARVKKIDALLLERAELPVGFRPPRKTIVASPPDLKGEGGIRAAMEVLGDEEMIARHAEAEAKMAKQHEAMEANRKKQVRMQVQMQKEFAVKTAAVDARFKVAKLEREREEERRQKEVFEQGQAQMRAAEKHETAERAAALERFDEETKRREAEKREARKQKRLEEAQKAARAAKSAEWALKTAKIKKKKAEAIEALRAELEKRDAKLEVYKRDLVRVRAERVEAAKAGKAGVVEKNLARAATLEARRREEWIQQRVARDAYVAAVKAAEDTAGKKEERDRAAAEKRARVKKLAEEKLEQKTAKIEAATRRAEAHLAEIQKRRAKESERVAFERKLRVVERVERVEDVARQKEVQIARLRDKIEEGAAKTNLLVKTKAAVAEERQLQNCRRALADSTRKQLEEETRRKAERKRWVAAQKFEQELLSAHASEASESPASKKKGRQNQPPKPKEVERLRRSGAERGATGGESDEGSEKGSAASLASAAARVPSDPSDPPGDAAPGPSEGGSPASSKGSKASAAEEAPEEGAEIDFGAADADAPDAGGGGRGRADRGGAADRTRGAGAGRGGIGPGAEPGAERGGGVMRAGEGGGDEELDATFGGASKRSVVSSKIFLTFFRRDSRPSRSLARRRAPRATLPSASRRWPPSPPRSLAGRFARTRPGARALRPRVRRRVLSLGRLAVRHRRGGRDRSRVARRDARAIGRARGRGVARRVPRPP